MILQKAVDVYNPNTGALNETFASLWKTSEMPDAPELFESALRLVRNAARSFRSRATTRIRIVLTRITFPGDPGMSAYLEIGVTGKRTKRPVTSYHFWPKTTTELWP